MMRFDLLKAVSDLATRVTKWSLACDRRLHRLMCYINSTLADRMVGYVGDSPENLTARLYADADFAGGHGRDSSEDPDSVKSRCGFVIRFGGVPLTWKSQLISEICLSTTHSEYVALVQSLRTLIPIRTTVIDALKFFKLPANEKPRIYCKVFEDNQSVYMLVNNQKPTATTKYFDVKWHWFWGYVYHPTRNPKGWLIVGKIGTDMQDADYLTKGLVRVKHESNRKRIQGW